MPRSITQFIENIYHQFPGQPVAFLDEAYRGFERPEQPFYLFTAVIVKADDMESMRKELLDIAGSTYWHTSEALRTPDGRARAKAMLRYLIEGVEPILIAKKVSVERSDSTLEGARRGCFRSLAIALTSGVEGVCAPVNLIVMERRNTSALLKIDARTFSDLRSEGAIPRVSRLVQASPNDDRLLWLPDVVSSAVRRSIAVGDDGMYDIVKEGLHVMTA